jgi:gliding motility-associated lipoprotein GldH
MNAVKRLFLCLSACALHFVSCTPIDLYEKTVAIPGHAWKSSFKPAFTFTIKDTAVQYQPFIILRHTDRYNYNNIYINLYVQLPNGDTVKRIHQNLELGNDETGWKGDGMDDIYEHRIALGGAEPFKKGDFIFTLEQVMREDPLQQVLDVGIRVEKVKK